MTREEMVDLMERVFRNEIQKLREAGQNEYTLGEDAFGNFNRLAAQLNMDRKKILWVYKTKHSDGIVSFINGHTSQREPVEGRINDEIVYLFLLRGMIEEEKAKLFKTDPNTAAREALRDSIQNSKPIPFQPAEQFGKGFEKMHGDAGADVG